MKKDNLSDKPKAIKIGGKGSMRRISRQPSETTITTPNDVLNTIKQLKKNGINLSDSDMSNLSKEKYSQMLLNPAFKSLFKNKKSNLISQSKSKEGYGDYKKKTEDNFMDLDPLKIAAMKRLEEK